MPAPHEYFGSTGIPLLRRPADRIGIPPQGLIVPSVMHKKFGESHHCHAVVFPITVRAYSPKRQGAMIVDILAPIGHLNREVFYS
jgi:hypothetical protein